MLIVSRVLVDVRDLLMHLPLNTPAQRRIELGQIADFHVVGQAPRLPCLPNQESAGAAPALQLSVTKIDNYFSSSLRYFSASMAAAQPDPAAVTAWR